jgi:TldD protein
MIRSKNTVKLMIFLVLALSMLFQSTLSAGTNKADTVLKAMEEELGRSMKVLGEKGTPPPYFISYRITDNYSVTISASQGSLINSSEDRSGLLDIDLRVGDHKLDNTHTIRGDRYSFLRSYLSVPVKVSIDNDPDAIKSQLWLETDKKYKDAVERLIQVKANKTVSVEEEDKSDDFSTEKPQQYVEATSTISPAAKAWEEKLKTFSALFNEYPDIYSSSVSLRAVAENKYFVNSEGTALQHGRTSWVLSLIARTKAEDGMELYKSRYFTTRTGEKLPDDKTIEAAVHQLAKDVIALKSAPLMEPYTGPAILSGRASGVFFHEIFGHRIEGHRQKDEEEGQTFTKKVNQAILPDFMSVYDDPTLKEYGDTDLNGHYLYDDEGQPGERVVVVEKGILKNFLMSRSPVEGFPKSNGHGRAQAGLQPVARQGNLIIESTETVPYEKLRQMLIDECKKQGKPYGLLFDDIAGGFTTTRRYGVQAFNVTPITVFRVYVDGRLDELVRGVNLIGTPLTSFSKIIACGDKHDVFNGTCGAESGGVPVSSASPPILTAQIEVEKKYKASDKPPVLPPPTRRKK